MTIPIPIIAGPYRISFVLYNICANFFHFIVSQCVFKKMELHFSVCIRCALVYRSNMLNAMLLASVFLTKIQFINHPFFCSIF